MSLFNWLVPKHVAPKSSVLPSDGLTVPPLHARPAKMPLPESDLKAQRQERREHLYTVVRDAMLRGGVLAASYKFKVLSLDLRGRQFLVMVDLLHADALAVHQFMEMEHWIAANAAQHHDLQVKAIYWRVNEMPMPSTVAPEPHKRGAESAVQPRAARARAGAFEPIGQDEVLAFKQAMAAGESRTFGPHQSSQPAEFADTELLEPDDTASPLSRTQFGGL